MKYFTVDEEPIIGSFVKTVIGVIVFILVLFNLPFVSVGAGKVGVVTQFGAVNRVVKPGLAWRLPFVEQVVEMETRTQKEQGSASAASKDLQEVISVIALNFHLQGDKAVEVYQDVGADYRGRIVDPALQEAFKATTAKFTAEELITKREAVKKLAFDELKGRLTKYGIIVDDLNIIDFDFSKDFNDAIEQKQVAQQNLEKAKVEATTALTQAQGQANAQKALKDSGSLSQEYLEFLALQKWNGVLPLATSGNPFISLPIK